MKNSIWSDEYRRMVIDLYRRPFYQESATVSVSPRFKVMGEFNVIATPLSFSGVRVAGIGLLPSVTRTRFGATPLAGLSRCRRVRAN